MGTQQILMIILSVIIVGTAIATGIQMFDKQYEKQTRLAIASELNRQAVMARAWYRTPYAMGGGGNGKDGDGNPIQFGQPELLQIAKYVDRGATPGNGNSPTFTNLIGTFNYVWYSSTIGEEVIQIGCSTEYTWSALINFSLNGQGQFGPLSTSFY